MENTNVEPTMKDIHNLVERLKKERYTFPTVEERIRAILEDFASQKGNLTRVYANAENIVECISIQSAHMRSMFEHFPEILLIDATHDTNASNYKLFSFMIHDALGKGQHVQHCLIENERKETLRLACKQFKEVLKEEFPGVRILLCHFHVVKYLQEEIAKEKYNLDAWTKKEMKRLVQLLVGAPTEVIYDNVIASMKVVLRADTKVKLWFDYFDENWTTCKEMWSSVYRGNVPHMGNQTNNRLESSWQKLKCLVNRSSTLDDCVVSILFWQTVNEKMWSRSVKRVSVYVNVEYDDEMNQLLNTVSRHAVELVKQQYDFAVNSTTEYRYYPVGSYVMMHYTEGGDDADLPDEYMLNPEAWTCSCMFRVTRLLPCRHIIYYRKVTGCSTLVPEEIIHRRWLLKNYRKLGQVNFAENTVVEAYEDRAVPLPLTTRTKTQNEKFKELFSIGRQIADVGAYRGTKAHTALSASLKRFLQVAQTGSCPIVVRHVETDRQSERTQTETANQSEMGTQSSTGTLPEATQVAGTAEESVEGLAVPPATEQNERDTLERDTVPDDTHFEVAQGVREPNEQPVSSSVVLSKPVVLSGSVLNSENVTQSQSGYECESSSDDNSVNAEKERPIRPGWSPSVLRRRDE
ncbi:hypothetical protein F442_19833 [Phytophthora nicotianae P10297]|uniref:SWIM-type domain-containing protein n=1 Tax=Phytophthora nicotianae P10297 TaxID=1317064 RepID=W2Y998_PHYNI|nr:hypothetical protein F442_19833 [Phytophthora nicotianae P10297]